MTEYKPHLDPMLPVLLNDIPAETIARLRKNGRAHMGRARKLNVARKALNKKLPPDLRRPMIEIVDFDPIDIYVAADWTCPECFKRVDFTKTGTHPESCVLGHLRNYAHDGGHTPDNCAPMHWKCNARIAAKIETPREAKINRLRASYRGISKDGSKASKKKKAPIGGRSTFGNGPSRWQSGQKIQSRNNLRRKD